MGSNFCEAESDLDWLDIRLNMSGYMFVINLYSGSGGHASRGWHIFIV